MERFAHTGGIVLLVLVTLVWGTTFALIKDITQSVSPYVLTALRFAIGGLIFLPFLRWDRQLWKAGLILGILNFLSYITQAVGLTLISSNRSAFITGLNVVMVPIALALLMRRWPIAKVWWAAGLSILGIGLISFDSLTGFSAGDLWTLACASMYAGYILYLEKSNHHNALALTAVQMVVVALLSALASGFELTQTGWPEIPASAWGGIFYLAVMATALTTFLMAYGQKTVSAAEAAIVYSLEPVFAALFAYLWSGETLGFSGVIGGCVIIGAMVLSQWPQRLPKPELRETEP